MKIALLRPSIERFLRELSTKIDRFDLSRIILDFCQNPVANQKDSISIARFRRIPIRPAPARSAGKRLFLKRVQKVSPVIEPRRRPPVCAVSPIALPTLPALPTGRRLYVVGDIHGRIDCLRLLLQLIDADRELRPIDNCLEVYLGDYVDRGPHSADVVSEMIKRSRKRHLIALAGNHDRKLIQAITDPSSVNFAWWQHGLQSTLSSYGINDRLSSSSDRFNALYRLSEAIPASHFSWLLTLRSSYCEAGYIFVHAGVRPGVPLANQNEEDLLWIREPFLGYERPFEGLVVHGHSPVPDIEFRANRIAVDTGAYATGRLSCLVLEGTQARILSAQC